MDSVKGLMGAIPLQNFWARTAPEAQKAEKAGDYGLRSWACENQRTDGDVSRRCRLMSGSECSTSDLILFQYQVPAELCSLNKNGTLYSISAD